jgi:hypothetical protein
MTREYGVDHLRDHGVLKPENAGEEVFAALNLADEIVSEFVFDGAAGKPRFRERAFAKSAQGTG